MLKLQEVGLVAIGYQTIRNLKVQIVLKYLIKNRLINWSVRLFAFSQKPGFERIVDQHQVKSPNLAIQGELFFNRNSITADVATLDQVLY